MFHDRQSHYLRKTLGTALLGAILLLVLNACNVLSSTATPIPEPTSIPPTAEVPVSTQPERGQAMVDNIEILILESFPVQVNVIAEGQLPDACTEIDEVITQFDGNEFRVIITTIRQPGQVCAQALTPFEETISLDVAGLPAGTYTVNVNGVEDSFTLDMDNAIPTEVAPTEEPEPTVAPTSPSAESGSIGGVVWHDLCPATGSAVGEDEALPDGCVLASETETIQADGVRSEDEPGIADVVVRLFAEDCTAAAPGEETIVSTDANGGFVFNDLSPGTYCVFFDTAEDINVAILEEGLLTYPTKNGVITNSVTVDVEGGTPAEDVNFGYDYQFRPLPDVAADDCVNSFQFVQDLTITDDTVFAPDTAFTAAWRVLNNGTCPWTEGYSVAFAGGDLMGAAESTPLPNTVAPGQSVDVSVDMTSPAEQGTYRGNWQLSNSDGQLFGIDEAIEDAFWVQIVVEEGTESLPTAEPGSATIGGVVWEDVCFLNSESTPSRGCVETEDGSGIYIGDGSLNFGEGVMPGVTVILGAGACPADGNIVAADRLETTVTDDDGLYRFPGLDAAIYCVAIDALSEENVDLMIPGNWTWPAPGVGRQFVRLTEGEQALTIDFGWDFLE